VRLDDFARSHRGLHACWMPQKYGTVVTLADIPRGRYDAPIDAMLTGLRAYPGPVVVRWGHEMNGHWSPWSAQYAAYQPGLAGCTSPSEWVAAWRYIVARERALAGPSNVHWFWCAANVDSHMPNHGPVVYPMEQYWPGSQWVDVVGVDGYNNNAPWQSFDAVFGPVYDRISTFAGTTMPWWIGETGCVEPTPGEIRGGIAVNKAAWIEQMFGSLLFPHSRPLAVHYFNFPNATFGDRRFSSSPSTYARAGAAYRSAINRHLWAAGAGVHSA